MSAGLWILFSIICGAMMIAGVRAKHKEEANKEEEQHPHRAA
jgi:hypothetical protein